MCNIMTENNKINVGQSNFRRFSRIENLKVGLKDFEKYLHTVASSKTHLLMGREYLKMGVSK